MMRTSWALRGRLQYILVNGLLQKKKNNDNEMKREEPKGDEYILMKAHEGEHLKTKLLHYGESP